MNQNVPSSSNPNRQKLWEATRAPSENQRESVKVFEWQSSRKITTSRSKRRGIKTKSTTNPWTYKSPQFSTNSPICQPHFTHAIIKIWFNWVNITILFPFLYHAKKGKLRRTQCIQLFARWRLRNSLIQFLIFPSCNRVTSLDHFIEFLLSNKYVCFKTIIINTHNRLYAIRWLS